MSDISRKKEFKATADSIRALADVIEDGRIAALVLGVCGQNGRVVIEDFFDRETICLSCGQEYDIIEFFKKLYGNSLDPDDPRNLITPGFEEGSCVICSDNPPRKLRDRKRS